MASRGCADPRPVRAPDTVGAARPGHDAAKKINGRHIVVDTTALLLVVLATAACPATTSADHSEAPVTWAMTGLMTRRLAPAPGRRP